MESTFIVKWTDDKLDWVADVSGYDKKAMWETLKGNEPIGLLAEFRRAIIHAQEREPFEVYSITVDGVTAKEFAKLFEDDPIGAKSLIRDRGRELYSLKEKYENRAQLQSMCSRYHRRQSGH